MQVYSADVSLKAQLKHFLPGYVLASPPDSQGFTKPKYINFPTNGSSTYQQPEYLVHLKPPHLDILNPFRAVYSASHFAQLLARGNAVSDPMKSKWALGKSWGVSVIVPSTTP